MTVKELIEQLQKMPQNLEVIYSEDGWKDITIERVELQGRSKYFDVNEDVVELMGR